MHVVERPELLTYHFHSFRPSDRRILKNVAVQPGGDIVFKSALDLYLRKWAEADWLTEYDIERIAIWACAQLPALRKSLCDMTLFARNSAQTENAIKTYSVFLSALDCEIPQARGAIGPSLHA